MQIPPMPTYRKDVEQLVKYHKSAFLALVAVMKKADPKQPIFFEKQKELLDEITTIIVQLDEKNLEWVQRVLPVALVDAQARSLVTMGIHNTVNEALKNVSTTEFAQARSIAVVQDTFQELLQATTFMSTNVKQTLRAVVSESLRQTIPLQQGRNDGIKTVYQQLVESGFGDRKTLGFMGIIDKAGRKWDLDVYSQMVVETKIQQTQLQGALIEVEEYPELGDLGLISSHGAKDACRYFEGTIVSMTGKNPDYPSLDSLRASNLIFHPRCKHTVYPIGSTDLLPKARRERHEQKISTAVRALEDPRQAKRVDGI